jgi:hypothetical protein
MIRGSLYASYLFMPQFTNLNDTLDENCSIYHNTFEKRFVEQLHQNALEQPLYGFAIYTMWLTSLFLVVNVGVLITWKR